MAKNITVDEHLATLPKELLSSYKALRLMASKTMPTAVEMVYHNALGYSLSKSPWDRVCYIVHQPKGYINFGFFFGTDIPDPAGLIQEEGKRMRHVKVHTLKEAKNPALQKLVEVAWEKSETDIAKWRKSLKKKK